MQSVRDALFLLLSCSVQINSIFCEGSAAEPAYVSVAQEEPVHPRHPLLRGHGCACRCTASCLALAGSICAAVIFQKAAVVSLSITMPLTSFTHACLGLVAVYWFSALRLPAGAPSHLLGLLCHHQRLSRKPHLHPAVLSVSLRSSHRLRRLAGGRAARWHLRLRLRVVGIRDGVWQPHQQSRQCRSHPVRTVLHWRAVLGFYWALGRQLGHVGAVCRYHDYAGAYRAHHLRRNASLLHMSAECPKREAHRHARWKATRPPVCWCVLR